MNSALALSLLAALLGAPTAPAPDEADLRSTIETYLGAIETPVPEERWRQLGPRAAPILAAIVASGDALPTDRARSLHALGLVDPQEASRLAGPLAADAQAPQVLRVTALRTLGAVLPAARLRTALQPTLAGDRSPVVRAVAAEVLARHGGAEGCRMVKASVAGEDEAERGKFHRSVTACP
jgi:hypothetical protein